MFHAATIRSFGYFENRELGTWHLLVAKSKYKFSTKQPVVLIIKKKLSTSIHSELARDFCYDTKSASSVQTVTFHTLASLIM